MISTDDVTNIAQSFFSRSTPQYRANKCSYMTTVMKEELEDLGANPERVLGEIQHNGESTGHAYLKLSSDEFEDIERGPVIIDVSVHQFSQEVVSDESLDVSIALDDSYDLPSENEVGIYTPKDSIYSIYG